MGVKLLGIASTYPPPPNPLPPGEGELLRPTFCKVSAGDDTITPARGSRPQARRGRTGGAVWGGPLKSTPQLIKSFQRREEHHPWLAVEYPGMRPGAANNYFNFP